jgi:hypothetical protein
LSRILVSQRRRTMLVDDLPGGLGSQVQMHMLSVDLSRALRASGRWTSPSDALSNTAFPVYAQARIALSGRNTRAPSADRPATAETKNAVNGKRNNASATSSATRQDISTFPGPVLYEDMDEPDEDTHNHEHDDKDIVDDEDDADADDGFRSSSWTDSADDDAEDSLPRLKDAHPMPLTNKSPLHRARATPEPSQRELRAARQAAARRAKEDAVFRGFLGDRAVSGGFRSQCSTQSSTGVNSSSAAFSSARRFPRLAIHDRPDRTPAVAAVSGLCQVCAARRNAEHDTFGRGVGGSSGSSAASDAQPIGGFLRKRGRLSRRLVRRFFTIEGSVLRNHRASPYDRPSWVVDVSGAVVGIDPDKARVVLLIDARRRLVLYGRSAVDARLWADALVTAAEHIPRRPCTRCTSETSKMKNMFNTTDRQDPKVDLDPANDIWDTFRSFAALTLLNSRKSERGSDSSRSARCRDEEDEVPPHMIYAAFS